MALFTQLLPLEIILPLLAALLCTFQKKYYYSAVIALLVNTVCLLISLILLNNININDSVILYNMGNWSAHYGIELKLTNFNCIILVLVNFITLMSNLYGFYAIPREISLNKISLFYSCFLLAYSGLIGIIITNDIFNLYVFLEVSSLAIYTLVASASNGKAYSTAFNYLIIGTISATFYLIGVGFLYSITGTLNMGVLAEKMPSLIEYSRIAQVGIAFILSGVIIKAALFPLHGWLIKVYRDSNSFIVAFLAGTSTKVGLYILIKYIYLIFGSALWHNEIINNLFIILALSAILLGSVCAFLQTNIRVMLAYSSVSQIGYIILAAFLTLGANAGLTSNLNINNLNLVLLIIIVHSLAKTSLFMLSGYLFHTEGITNLINDITNVTNNNGNEANININNRESSRFNSASSLIASICCLISGASLIGIPLTGGFIGKFSLLNATIISQNYLATLIVIISSVLTALYMWKFAQLFFNNAFTQAELGKKPSSYIINVNHMAIETGKLNLQKKFGFASERILYVPLLSCGISIILIGIYAKPLMSLLIVL